MSKNIPLNDIKNLIDKMREGNLKDFSSDMILDSIYEYTESVLTMKGYSKMGLDGGGYSLYKNKDFLGDLPLLTVPELAEKYQTSYQASYHHKKKYEKKLRDEMVTSSCF